MLEEENINPANAGERRDKEMNGTKLIKSKEHKASFLGTKAGTPRAKTPTVFATKKQKGFVTARAVVVSAAKIAKPQVKSASKVFNTVTMARPAPAPVVSLKIQRQRATRLELMKKHGLR